MTLNTSALLSLYRHHARNANWYGEQAAEWHGMAADESRPKYNRKLCRKNAAILDGKAMREQQWTDALKGALEDHLGIVIERPQPDDVCTTEPPF